MTDAPSVLVVHGDDFDLCRPGLAVPAPLTRRRLDHWCRGWAEEVGWRLTTDPAEADGIVIGPGGRAPDGDLPAVAAVRGRGVDGYRWALAHLAWHRSWPPETRSYGPHPDQVVDLRRPPGQPRGVAALLHGGFWLDPWRRDLMDGVAVDLARRGWLTCNVEYRRLGAGGGWPQTGDDVLAALDRFAGDGAVIVGHSAGATLGLWAARERDVAGVVALAGVCDLAAAAREGLGGGAVERFLAGAATAVLSPLERVPPRAPVVLAHGRGDALVPVAHSRRYVLAARARGAEVVLVEPPNADHFSLIVPAADWRGVARHLPGVEQGADLRTPRPGPVDTPGDDT